MSRRFNLGMEETFQVNRRPEECFDYITDFSLLQDWDHTVVASEKISYGKIGVGSQFNVWLSMGGRKILMDYKITEFEYPGRAILIGKADNFTAVDTVTVKESDSGCVITWEAKITFKGLSARLVPIFKKQVENSGRKTIEGLKMALEDDFVAPELTPSVERSDKWVLPGLYQFTKMGYKRAR